MSKIISLGISKSKITSMLFLLFIVLISLSLSNVSFLVDKSISTLPIFLKSN